MANTQQMKFYLLKQSKYDQLNSAGQLLASGLYFVTDTYRIYKGNTLYANDVVIISKEQADAFSAEEQCTAITNKLYIDSETGSMYVNIEKKFTEIGIPAETKAKLAYLTTIETTDANKIVTVSEDGSKFAYSKNIVDTILSTATNDDIPTAKAVRDLIGAGASNNNPLLVQINETTGEVEEGTGVWKLNPVFNKGIDIYFNNDLIEIGATKVNFAGTVTPTRTEDGQVKIQIGDNMNSSSWNNTANNAAADGKTNGKVTDLSTSAGYLNGNSVNYTKTATLTFTSAEGIHFNVGKNVWTVNITADGETIATAELTDNVTLNKVDGQDKPTVSHSATDITGTGVFAAITSSITSALVLQPNYPKSVGAKGKRSFTISLATLHSENSIANKAIVITISGCGGKFVSKTFYYVTGVTPTIGDVSLSVTKQSVVYYSGVEYYTLGTLFEFKAQNISNLNNQIQVGSSVKKLDFSASNMETPVDIYGSVYSKKENGVELLKNATSAQDNVCEYLQSDLEVVEKTNSSDISVTLKAVNAFGSVSKTASLTLDKPINSYGQASTDTEEKCKSENKRYINSSISKIETEPSLFVSNATLATDELQLIPGVGIQYPANGGTETRYFARKFVKDGSLTGLTLVFEFSKGSLSDVVVEMMKGENVWTPINKFNGTYSYATADSTNTKAQGYKLVLVFADTNVDGKFYLRVGMTNSNAIITNIKMG